MSLLARCLFIDFIYELWAFEVARDSKFKLQSQKSYGRPLTGKKAVVDHCSPLPPCKTLSRLFYIAMGNLFLRVVPRRNICFLLRNGHGSGGCLFWLRVWTWNFAIGISVRKRYLSKGYLECFFVSDFFDDRHGFIFLLFLA